MGRDKAKPRREKKKPKKNPKEKKRKGKNNSVKIYRGMAHRMDINYGY